MEAMIGEQDESLSGLNHLNSLKHIVDTHQKNLGNLCQMWLLETQVSHPTMMSAASYFTPHDGGFHLHRHTLQQESIGLAACQAILGAVDSYGRTAGLQEQSFESGLQPLLARLAPFMFDKN